MVKPCLERGGAFFIMEGQETQTQEVQGTQELSVEQFFGAEEPVVQQEEQPTEEVAEQTTEPEEIKSEETPSEEAPVSEMTDDRFNELVTKAESEELSEEELTELKDAGHEVGVEDPSVEEILELIKNGEDVDATNFSEETINALAEQGVEIDSEEEPVEWQAPEVASEFQDLVGDQFDVSTQEGFNEAAKNVINQYKTITSNLNGVLEQSPELQKVIADMMEGKSDFMTAAALHLGFEDLAPSPGDDGYEAFVKAKTQKEIDKEALKKEQTQVKENWKKSQENTVQYFKDNEVSQDRRKTVVDAIDDFVAKYAKGNVDPKYVEIFTKGLFADTDSSSKAKQEVAKALNKRYVIKKKNVGGKPTVRSTSVDAGVSTNSLDGIKRMFGEA